MGLVDKVDKELPKSTPAVLECIGNGRYTLHHLKEHYCLRDEDVCPLQADGPHFLPFCIRYQYMNELSQGVIDQYNKGDKK